MKKIDYDFVVKEFEYNPDTGELLVSRPRGRGGRYKKGDKVGSIHVCGPKNSKRTYLRTAINGSYFYVHRIIWVMMKGEQPINIDHIDGDGLNNKWSNLRSVTSSENGKNQKIHTTNTSGKSGVTYRKESGKWRARILVDGKMISLGNFYCKTDAVNKRLEAEKKYWR